MNPEWYNAKIPNPKYDYIVISEKVNLERQGCPIVGAECAVVGDSKGPPWANGSSDIRDFQTQAFSRKLAIGFIWYAFQFGASNKYF